MRTAMAKKVTADPNTIMAVQAILNSMLGWGNVLVGPLSAQLIRGTAQRGSYGISRYEDVVYFSGSCMLGSAAILLVPYLRKLKPGV